MRILFLGLRYTYFKNFETVIRELANRGHSLHLAIEQDYEQGLPMVTALAAECPRITYGVAPGRADDDWRWVVTRVRPGLDHLRYQQRAFDDTPMLRERSRERTPGLFVRLGDVVRRVSPWMGRPVIAFLRWLERAVPMDPVIPSFIEQHRPDVVLVTPLITLGSAQIDYLRAARAMRIPTALCVGSWDHLSSKALIRTIPDRVFVWNETQKREAVEMHTVPGDRVVVTGAQCFDRWFDRTPSRNREAFCAATTLPAHRPYILYVCSAPFLGSPPEAPFVIEWIRRIRSGTPAPVRGAAILVRPHPSRRAEWEQIDLRGLNDVTVWGSDPVDADARADYFDSMYHSAVVVGLNTSAFIEAGIVGRPVCTILLPEWQESQRGTLHFRYLLEENGGLLKSATTFEEHVRQLDDALQQRRSGIHPFVKAFVRPHGLEVSATPMFATQIEEMQTIEVAAPIAPRMPALAGLVLQAGIKRRQDVRFEQWLYSERELEAIVRNRAARQKKTDRDDEIKRTRAAHKAMRAAARDAERERYRREKQRLSS